MTMFPYRLGEPIQLLWKDKPVEDLTHEELLAAVYECWNFRVEKYGPAIQGMVPATDDMIFAGYAVANGNVLKMPVISREKIAEMWGKMLEVYVAQTKDAA